MRPISIFKKIQLLWITHKLLLPITTARMVVFNNKPLSQSLTYASFAAFSRHLIQPFNRKNASDLLMKSNRSRYVHRWQCFHLESLSLSFCKDLEESKSHLSTQLSKKCKTKKPSPTRKNSSKFSMKGSDITNNFRISKLIYWRLRLSNVPSPIWNSFKLVSVRATLVVFLN